MTIVVAARGADDFFLGILNMSFSAVWHVVFLLWERYMGIGGGVMLSSYLFCFKICLHNLFIAVHIAERTDVLTWHINHFVKI